MRERAFSRARQRETQRETQGEREREGESARGRQWRDGRWAVGGAARARKTAPSDGSALHSEPVRPVA